MLQRIILPISYGQTCNQLVQIAHWIPVATECHLPLYFPAFRPYAHLFCGTEQQKVPCYPRTSSVLKFPEDVLSQLCSSHLPIIKNIPFFLLASALPGIVTFDWEKNGMDGNINPACVLENPRIAGGKSLWVRSWLYRDHFGVSKHKQRIKEFFTPVPEIQKLVHTCIQQNRRDNTVLIGVHLRRGDYRSWHGGKYYL